MSPGPAGAGGRESAGGREGGLPYVSVRGEAVMEVNSEVARLAVTVSAQDRSRARAMERLQERSEAVLGRFRGLGAAIEKIETTSVRLVVQYKGDRSKERVEGYGAQLTHTVTVSDFGVLGDLIVGLAEDESAQVAGPWWSLRPDSDVHRQVRVAAVREAVERARQYAGALGSRLTGLVHLADVGLLGEAGPVPSMPMAAARVDMLAAPGEPATLQVEPARQVVRAAVEARFTVSPPDLG